MHAKSSETTAQISMMQTHPISHSHPMQQSIHSLHNKSCMKSPESPHINQLPHSQHVEDKFQLVMITEFMDESLVLLKRLWCWNMSDILYLSSKVSMGSRLLRVNALPSLCPLHRILTLWTRPLVASASTRSQCLYS